MPPEVGPTHQVGILLSLSFTFSEVGGAAGGGDSCGRPKVTHFDFLIIVFFQREEMQDIKTSSAFYCTPSQSSSSYLLVIMVLDKEVDWEADKVVDKLTKEINQAVVKKVMMEELDRAGGCWESWRLW